MSTEKVIWTEKTFAKFPNFKRILSERESSSLFSAKVNREGYMRILIFIAAVLNLGYA